MSSSNFSSRMAPVHMPSTPPTLSNPTCHSSYHRQSTSCCAISNRLKTIDRFQKARLRVRSGGLSVFACSTMPFEGRVGWQRREGTVSFGVHPSGGDVRVSNSDDASQVLSALLPFVVAATAVAALAQPSTFTWVSKELYAPALGGIMLSIGIQLSINDFRLTHQGLA